MRRLDPSTWTRALGLSVVAALLIAIPADLIDNRFFGRPIEPRSFDYIVLIVTAALIGLILAIRRDPSVASDQQERRTVLSGFASFLAVGCPVCNQAVVAVVGVSGALNWWAPIQPMLGVVAIALLIWTLRQRLVSPDGASCAISAR